MKDSRERHENEDVHSSYHETTHDGRPQLLRRARRSPAAAAALPTRVFVERVDSVQMTSTMLRLAALRSCDHERVADWRWSVSLW